jgi:cation:H+ antiporter
MPVLMPLILLAVGVAVLVKAADLFTDAAVETARRFRVPEMLVGVTLVSIATTLPECSVSLLAAARGNIDTAVGNAIGSTICNMALILGLCALLSPMVIAPRTFRLNMSTMLAAMLLFSGLAWLMPGGGRIVGLLMLGMLAYHFYRSVCEARRHVDDAPPVPPKGTRTPVLAAQFVLGAAGVVGGSLLVVSSAERLAEMAGIPELVISLTLVAVGTSLPELTVSLAAIVKGQRGLSTGNILGANILNLGLAIGGSSLVRPLPLQRQTLVLDLPVMLLLAVTLLIFGLTGGRLSRREGTVMLGIYIAYLAVVFTVFRAG